MARIKLPDALNKDNADEAMDMIKEVCDDFYEKLKQLSENHQSTSLITAIEARFSNFLFFPMSALGLVNQNMSIPSSFLDASPEPVGVVHPLYWVLKKVGFL